jgi:hypothetical protein
VNRHLALVVAVLASIVCWFSPLVLVGRFESWWFLTGYLLTVPACEACWWAHDRTE